MFAFLTYWVSSIYNRNSDAMIGLMAVCEAAVWTVLVVQLSK